MVARAVVFLILIVSSSWDQCQATSRLRSTQYSTDDNHRNLQAAPYHTLTSTTLGTPNPDAASGNILKGLVENPVYTNPPYKSKVPLSMEFYYLDFDTAMKGNPNIVGEQAAINWDYLEHTLKDSASRNMHAVWRFVLDFPYHWSGNSLRIPEYLIAAGADIRNETDGSRVPNYSDPKIAEAIEQFIRITGKRYNGDKRLGYVQLGMLGHWGEWHGPYITETMRESVIRWFASSYNKTELQTRYPDQLGYDLGMGRHDDSFAYETVDGVANGGLNLSYYYWPDLVQRGQSDYWKRGAMGGETRGELQSTIFEPTYPGRTPYKQDFMECVNVTHTTWMWHHNAFRDGGYNETELANALFAHARMGYNFHVPSVAVKLSPTAGQVDIDVTVTQIGVAPFYYDLRLGITCSGMANKTLNGVDTIIDQWSSKVFSFTGIPATAACLGAVSLYLDSSYGYAGRPIKFAQGNGSLKFSLPLPGSNPIPTMPVSVPVAPPVAMPVQASPTVPRSTPVASPVQAPVAPVSSPVGVPVRSPTVPISSPIVAAPTVPVSSPVASPAAVSTPLTPPVQVPTAPIVSPISVPNGVPTVPISTPMAAAPIPTVPVSSPAASPAAVPVQTSPTVTAPTSPLQAPAAPISVPNGVVPTVPISTPTAAAPIDVPAVPVSSPVVGQIEAPIQPPTNAPIAVAPPTSSGTVSLPKRIRKFIKKLFKN